MSRFNSSADQERVHVGVFINGACLHLRFPSESAYAEFKTKVRSKVEILTLVYGQNNDRLLVRPSRVDAINEGRST